ncbi:Aste57867_124 [Aphanomyces stellatus]|uniref:Aste57867_124 protein n=1 Tax=Aphanomyces stellatus TaxID=120398 RepID=A0A485K4U2_9STRA|nr:hypothetical protein As57867_000124 [Aphanomyces stellatus]VFT77350.1 Aste57867_124 [Aphanomyces stellatus]
MEGDVSDAVAKPADAPKSPSRGRASMICIAGSLGRAWVDGPAIDLDHFEFTEADYARRKQVVVDMRARFKLKSLPGSDQFPPRPRTLRAAAEKYARCNLYFLPFVSVTLTDAVWDGDLVNVARLLVKRVPPDSRDKQGHLALTIAIRGRHNAIAKFLLDKKAKLDLQDEDTLHTPLHMAIIMGNKSMARRLIESGADVELRDAEGLTPLLWATIRGFLETVGLLLLHGADVNGRDSTGMTPLHVACFKGYMDLVDFLLHNGTVVKSFVRSIDRSIVREMALTNGRTGKANLALEDENGFSPSLYARIEEQGEVLDRIQEFLDQKEKDATRRARRAAKRAARLARQEAAAQATEDNPNSLI